MEEKTFGNQKFNNKSSGDYKNNTEISHLRYVLYRKRDIKEPDLIIL